MATFKALDINHKLPRITDPGIWADVRYDANDDAPIYVGMNRTNGASTTTDSTWKIYKFTYSGADVTRIQLAYGTWGARVSLFP